MTQGVMRSNTGRFLLARTVGLRVEAIAWKHMCCLRVIWMQLNTENYFEGPPLGYCHFIFMRYRKLILPQLQLWHLKYLPWLVSVNSVGDAHSQVRQVLHLMSYSDAAAAVQTQRLADVDKDQSITNVQCVS
jgi:hypothetical protein